MTNFMVEYTYTDDSAKRDELRPVHRAYLESLVSTGQMLAYGRFGQDGPAGALLLVAAESSDEVEALLAADPYVLEGQVGSHRIREWIGTWGAIPR
ncbi:YciI family protein [Demequina aurantiaca]|uniref:YciI family protein n=1 Tax=Demequina aurantiaca TaxID=676200 RepID=UPI003D359799